MDINKCSLLIVDDEKSNIIVLSQMLSPDYTVYAARNGPDAIEVANEYQPDVILLDIIMPDMDGYEVISALKASDKTQNIPIIFVTGLSDAKDEEKGLRLGAADYIYKPFNEAIVKLRVQNQIDMLNYINTIKRYGLTDQLTDIPNRRSFDERLRVEWNRSVRDKTYLSILIIDIDNFKLYNDTYGHQQGDIALRTAGKAFVRELRRLVDFAARIGGEEFAVLINTNSNGAMEVAERVRKSIENTVIPLIDGTPTRITVSIGVNTLIPSPENDCDDFVRYADDALYNAKNEGRNKVCRYE